MTDRYSEGGFREHLFTKNDLKLSGNWLTR